MLDLGQIYKKGVIVRQYRTEVLYDDAVITFVHPNGALDVEMNGVKYGWSASTCKPVEQATMWKKIVDHPNYAVSRDGFVKSLKRDLILQPRYDKDGYNTAVLYNNGMPTGRRVHRLVLEAYVGPCPEGMQVRHLDGDVYNNNLDNLAYGTAQQNQADRKKHGTAVGNGSANAASKLTETEVLEIRKLRCNENTRSLADRYGVTPSLISAICTRRRWRHI